MPAVDAPRLLRWDGERLVADEPAEGRLLAADSWLVDDGLVLAPDRHRDRFLTALPEHRRADAERCWEAVAAALPRRGAWFPRIELLRLEDGREQLRLLVRPAPPRERAVVVATHRGADPRTLPLVKGPDLAALGAVRRGAAARGAGEGVLLSPEGFVTEGAYSALAWWRDGALHVVDGALPRIRSVTEAVLRAATAEQGVAVAHVLERPAELEGCELWVLSALHGPRLATGWVDGPRLAAEPGRLETWRAAMNALKAPLA